MYRIYILSHNRPEFIVQCFESVDAAANIVDDVEVIISENSTNRSVEDTIKRSNISAVVKKRQEYMSGIQHINFCIEEARLARKKYVCVFHDDDVMRPGFITETLKAFSENPNAAAVAFDISTIWSRSSVQLYNTSDLLENIFSVHNSQIIPFPGYTYNLDITGSIFLDEKIGKHGDAEFLLRVSELGPISIIKSAQVRTAIHSGSDSYAESILARRRLLTAVMSKHNIEKSFFNGYRMAYILRKKKLNKLSFEIVKRKRLFSIWIVYILKRLRIIS